jgi:membrane protein implicated in regulation of membrane protease activity
MDFMFWAWLIFAAVCFIGEMLTAGFFLIVFAVGAAGATIVAAVGGSQVWQWASFIVLSTLTFAFSRKIANRIHRGPEGLGVGAERYKGMRGRITEQVDNAAATGMVRIDREEWQAESVDGQVIPAETWAVVVKVDGTRMMVEPAEEMAPADAGPIAESEEEEPVGDEPVGDEAADESGSTE